MIYCGETEKHMIDLECKIKDLESKLSIAVEALEYLSEHIGTDCPNCREYLSPINNPFVAQEALSKIRGDQDNKA